MSEVILQVAVGPEPGSIENRANEPNAAKTAVDRRGIGAENRANEPNDAGMAGELMRNREKTTNEPNVLANDRMDVG
jgi:hypothetical protein